MKDTTEIKELIKDMPLVQMTEKELEKKLNKLSDYFKAADCPITEAAVLCHIMAEHLRKHIGHIAFHLTCGNPACTKCVPSVLGAN